MNDRAYRIVLLQALAYLIAGVFFVSGQDFSKKLTGFDQTQAASFIATSFMSIAVLWIWRRHIRWTGLRTSSTFALTVLMFAQVIIWQPMLGSTDCVITQALPPAQSLSMVGLWCAGCCVVWWAPVLRMPLNQRLGRNVMSPEAVRLALGGALIPFLPGVFWLTYCLYFIVSNGSINGNVLVWASYQTSTMIGFLSWFVLWRKRVTWSARCKGVTAMLACILLLSPLSVFLETQWNA